MISQYLIDVYKTTEYKIPNLDIVIRVDKTSEKLDSILKENNVTSWAFITAYNPFSEALSNEENEKLHQSLIQLVHIYFYYEGFGIGVDPTWPPEKSLLLLGIKKEQAIDLGNIFKQNAIVIGDIGHPAELVILK